MASYSSFRCRFILVATGLLLSSNTFGFEVKSFSPEGTVKGIRQVKASFSEDMIAFGDAHGPRVNDPFELKCEAPGHGRWADTKNWVYDFDHDLLAGVQCSFKTKAGLQSHSGTALTGRSEFSFNTGGPAIKSSEPWEGSEIDEEQIFILALDAQADVKTIQEHVYFEVDGISEKIPVKVLDQDPRKAEAGSGGFSAKVKLWAHKFGFPTRVGKRHEAAAEAVIQAERKFPP